MSGLSTLRLGADPRAHAEFARLSEELAKLSHPACPDVDWAKVEHYCVVLFQLNGADLQTAAAFALARSHRGGLGGLAQGLALLQTLANAWPQVWPPMASTRLDIFAWLFGQWQPWLRGLALQPRHLPAVLQVQAALEQLHETLEQCAQVLVVPLLAFRQQAAQLGQRLQREQAEAGQLPLPVGVSAPPWGVPVVIVSPAPALPMLAPRRWPWRWCAAVLGITLVLALTGQQGLHHDQAPKPPEPIRFDSLALFDPGSAQLKASATKPLVNALAGIKAQPGWLIVIAGHTDASGDAEQNAQLSQARAAAVREWMQRMGDLPDSCFAVQGLAATSRSPPTTAKQGARPTAGWTFNWYQKPTPAQRQQPEPRAPTKKATSQWPPFNLSVPPPAPCATPT